MSQAPDRGANMVMIAGSDNIILPSQPLCTISGTPFHTLHATQGANHLFCFSKEVQVLDDSDDVIDEVGRERVHQSDWLLSHTHTLTWSCTTRLQSVLDSLEQLGIMLVDQHSHPVLFLEKAPRATIVSVLRSHKRKSVYFNAFCFALSCTAASWIADRYEQVFETKDFDWSGHVLEALACYSADEWLDRLDSRKSQVFDLQQWQLLYRIADEFRAEFGAPVIVCQQQQQHIRHTCAHLQH
jgi:hypothetical protein